MHMGTLACDHLNSSNRKRTRTRSAIFFTFCCCATACFILSPQVQAQPKLMQTRATRQTGNSTCNRGSPLPIAVKRRP
ncbi:hypothetical protein MTO96_020525, partial [Rhipicephalus appendiculatus]